MSTQYVKLCTRRGVRAAPGERSRSGCVAMAVARRRSSPSRTTSAAPAKAVAERADMRTAVDTPADQTRTADVGLPTEHTLRDMRAYMKQSSLIEYDYWVHPEWVDGAVPKELQGTYLRNGSGMQASGRHPFDGDGQVISLAFRDGHTFFRNRFVKTKGFLDEQKAGRPLYRNSFTRGSPDGSLLFNPLDFNLKVCVCVYGGVGACPGHTLLRGVGACPRHTLLRGMGACPGHNHYVVIYFVVVLGWHVRRERQTNSQWASA
mmetsp:Transcript_29065/g.86041  ORF Transcript_29065/g.86041 Transcript_29065/m.86041 type:complete len:262 (-) Transcript_29065:2848-3633(-)